MKKIIIILLAFNIISFTSCDIDRLPSTAIPADEITNDPDAYLEYLINGSYGLLKSWSDVMHRCGEYAGDNMMIRGSSTDSFYEFISYSRTPNNGRLQNFWDYSYRVIAQSSNVMTMFEEGVSDELDHKIGESYFLRGMLYFYLCRAYGRPYYQSPETNLGVPIVNGTPEVMPPTSLPDRSTVKDTYAQAIADLEKSIQLMNKNNGPAYASKEAAYALLSRIYLYMSGTWENPNKEYAQKAIEYADLVLGSDKYELLTRENFMKYNTFTPETNKESIFVVKRVASEFSGSDHYYGIGGMYANIGGMGWGEMFASAKYLALLDETGRNDWANEKIVDARAAFIEPYYVKGKDEEDVFRFIKNTYNSNGEQVGYDYSQFPYERSGNNLLAKEKWTIGEGDNAKADSIMHTLKLVDEEQRIYSIEYTDGIIYQGYLDKKIRLNRAYPEFYITRCSREGEESHLHSPIITRLGEVYLNKAEAAAKLGDYGTARTNLNIIRERSLPGEGYASLSADNAADLIEKERQLELAFHAERSYDVFRNGRALTRPYPGPHDAMHDVPPTDYRVVYFIPQTAINSYPGGSKLTQNPLTN